MVINEPIYYGDDAQPSKLRTVFTGAVLIVAILTIFGKGPLRKVFR